MNYAHSAAVATAAKDPDQYVEVGIYAPTDQAAPHWSETCSITIGSVDHVCIGWMKPAQARELAAHLTLCADHADRHIAERERAGRGTDVLP